MRVKRFIKDSKVVISFILGIMLTATVSYGTSQLESSSVSYTKQGGELTTVKGALDELITKSSKVDDLEKKVTDYEKKVHYLADKVHVGDYVAYDAGTWKESANKPTSENEFGGYTINTSKNSSVEWCWSSSRGSTTLKGWRVLDVNKDTKIVTIVHAGQPECYYHASGGNPDASVKALNDRANNYKNTYAQSAHAMTYEEALAITKSKGATENDLRKTGDFYWLANASGVIDSLWSGGNDGHLGYDSVNYKYSFGLRPVIILKPDVLTTGQGKDQVGNENAWILA